MSIELKCPVCKADRLQSPPCRRCKADLTLLFQLAEQRRSFLDQACKALQAGQWQEAELASRRAHLLNPDAESRRFLALSALMQGEYALAWQLYQQTISAS